MPGTKHIVLLLIAVCIASAVWGHTIINYAMEKAPAHEVIGYYFRMGVTHIIPEGFDHILFIISLCLLSNKIRTIFWQATAFTVAHSVTLALSMKNILVAPGAVVEPVISLSIVFVAIENIVLNELKAWRILVVFMFGLIHGMGFASALNGVGLPRNQFFTSVLSFNLGVEAGQIIVILLVFGLIILPFGKKYFYRKRIVYPLSVIIAMIAAYWTVERIMVL
ncbi:HupE/UreJ family protein [Danxiaibacter flavus]|uniref:HupE/UreJ family protein n=1 Tax=Danxiaibacter flavus TaxID=3049108 RepID=A0ABV3ZBJ8_9BACT|nr:HupE/UreJ family protein [Chitinophagaceae bacterium DXS]